jgi:hypothetical protein
MRIKPRELCKETRPMTFPPIRPNRCLLWITLHPDETVRARYEALRAVLNACRLHPLDTTPVSQVVIVEEAAIRPRMEDIRALLGPNDMLHMVTTVGERLRVTVIAPPGVMADDLARRPAERRPTWLRES